MNLAPQPLSDRPTGYPAEFEQQVTLRDGRRVDIRPILPTDAPELAEAIKTADAETLYRRFLGGPPRVTAALLRHLTVVDYVHRFALVAIDPATQRGVAIARYEQTSPGVAEIAVAVTPTWRRAGLATTLILLLAKAAVARGIHTFSASYLAENRPIAALVHDAGGAGTQLIHQGIAEFSLALDNEPAAPEAGRAGNGQHGAGEAQPAAAAGKLPDHSPAGSIKRTETSQTTDVAAGGDPGQQR